MDLAEQKETKKKLNGHFLGQDSGIRTAEPGIDPHQVLPRKFNFDSDKGFDDYFDLLDQAMRGIKDKAVSPIFSDTALLFEEAIDDYEVQPQKGKIRHRKKKNKFDPVVKVEFDNHVSKKLARKKIQAAKRAISKIQTKRSEKQESWQEKKKKKTHKMKMRRRDKRLPKFIEE